MLSTAALLGLFQSFQRHRSQGLERKGVETAVLKLKDIIKNFPKALHDIVLT